jgi:hypothetical protein
MEGDSNLKKINNEKRNVFSNTVSKTSVDLIKHKKKQNDVISNSASKTIVDTNKSVINLLLSEDGFFYYC